MKQVTPQEVQANLIALLKELPFEIVVDGKTVATVEAAEPVRQPKR